MNLVNICHRTELQMFFSRDENFSDLLSSVQFSLVAQSGPTLCNPMNRSTPGLPVHHQLLEFTQTHIHRVSDAIQPSHPLSSSSPPAPSPSWVRVGPKSEVFWEERRKGDERSEGEKTWKQMTWRWRQRLEKCVYKPRDTEDCWQPQRVRRDWATVHYHWQMGKKHKMDALPEPLKGTNPANTFTSGFCPPELWGNKFLLF